MAIDWLMLIDVGWCWLQCPTSVPQIAVQSGACQRTEEATQKKRLNHRRARHVEHSLLRSFFFFLPLVIEQMTLGPQHQRFLRWFAHSLLDLITGTVLNCSVIASCGTYNGNSHKNNTAAACSSNKERAHWQPQPPAHLSKHGRHKFSQRYSDVLSKRGCSNHRIQQNTENLLIIP